MTSVRGRGQPARRGQASKALTCPPLSNRSDDRDYEDLLGLNEPRPSEAPAEAPAGPPQALSPSVPPDPGINCYSQQNLNRII